MMGLKRYVTSLVLALVCFIFIQCGAGVTETCNPGSCSTGFTSSDDGGTTSSGGAQMGDGSGIFDGDAETITSDSTGTGEDTFETDDTCSYCDAEPMQAPAATANDLLEAVCTILAGCYGTDVVQGCEDSLDTDHGMLTEFGVDTDSYDSFTAIQDAINEGELSASGAEISTCNAAIEALECSDIEVSGAFDETTPEDYTNVYLMIPDEC